MSDHLPECCVPWPDGSRLDQCICDRLRAAGQRATAEMPILRSAWQGREDGYRRGIQAAADAVAAIDPDTEPGDWDDPGTVWDAVTRALDTLKGDHA